MSPPDHSLSVIFQVFSPAALTASQKKKNNVRPLASSLVSCDTYSLAANRHRIRAYEGGSGGDYACEAGCRYGSLGVGYGRSSLTLGVTGSGFEEGDGEEVRR